jgi:ribosomal protein S18 acetylase RimI-like enzyme
MNIQYWFPKSTDEKFKLMKFVYDNTDSFILNTFGYVWESRGWWDRFPIQVYMVGDVLAGIHAFTVDTKAPDTIKTYYIVTGKAFRGQGIGKKLTMDILGEYSNANKKYFVNSEENSDGVGFYKKLFDNRYKVVINEFDTVDFIFEEGVTEIYNRLKNEKV